MPIISVTDNENNRWKRDANKKTKQKKKQVVGAGGAEAIVKGWELNYFVLHLS